MCGAAPLDNSAVVRQSTKTVNRCALDSAHIPRNPQTTSTNRSCASTVPKTETDVFQIIRESLEDQGFSAVTASIICNSWRGSTKLQYGTYLKKWLHFCRQRQVDFMQVSVQIILEFLTELFKAGLGYSGISSAKAVVMNFVVLTANLDLEKHNFVLNKFMRGVFALKPALPRYSVTWDVSRVLDYLKTQSPAEALTLRALTCKLATLLLLLTGQRGQTIHSLQVSSVTCKADMLILRFPSLLKTSRPGKHTAEVVLPAFAPDPRLCVVQTFQAYITRTKRYRKGLGKLFIITVRPFTPVSRDAFGKWIRETLMKAGIDLSIFGPHTVRAASTSKACAVGVPLATIVRTAGWEASNTFRKFYHRPIVRSAEFAEGILNTL